MKNLLLIAQYEYQKTIRKKSFWFTTLFMPVLMAVVFLVSGFSSIQSEKLFTELSEEIKTIHIIDEVDVVLDELIQRPLEKVEDLGSSVNSLQAGDVDAIIHFPGDLFERKKIDIYLKDDGNLFGQTVFSALAHDLVDQSSILKIKDERVQQLLSIDLSEEVILFDDNNEKIDQGIEKYIVPAISTLIFFLSVFISVNFLLQSVSEEKENRMMEIVLSITSKEKLIYGKILGLSSVVITQLFIWILFGFVVVYIGVNSLEIPIALNFSNIPLYTIPINIYFTLMGFLLFAAIMTGVGAIGTSYKDSQNLSTVFILLAIFPIYFITIILAEPNGLIAQITSYFPLTAPMIFVIRNSITELSAVEILVGMVAVFIYVFIAFKLAIKMFSIGALMYARKPTWKEIVMVFFER